MKKNYQTKTAAAMTVPDSVAIAMTDLADELREGLLALAVGTGLQVMDVLLEESVTALAGPKGRHDPDRDSGAPRTRGRLGYPRRTQGAGAAPEGAFGRRLG